MSEEGDKLREAFELADRMYEELKGKSWKFVSKRWYYNEEGEPMLSTHDYVGNITDDQKAYCEKIREAFKLVESVIMEHPSTKEMNFSSRCFSLSRTFLEQACQYAIKGTVFDGKEVYGYGTKS